MENTDFEFNYYEGLIIKCLANNISNQEIGELQAWINKSPQNKETFDRFRASWVVAGIKSNTTRFDTQQAYLAVQSGMDRSFSPVAKENPRIRILTSVMKYAAIALLFFTLGGLIMWMLNPGTDRKDLSYTVITAPMGAKSYVDLPDGTKVWLNAGSKLKYNFSYGKENRSVILIGEGYFDVAKIKDIPFLVQTSKVEIKALGTKFNVKAYSDEQMITATLEEGKIEVRTTGENIKQQTVILLPNERASFYANTLSVSRNVNTTLYTSWKDNKWILEGITLGSLGTMMERRYNITMIFNNESLRDYKFTGTIENRTLEQILSAIKFTAPIEYKIHKDTVLIDVNSRLTERFKKLQVK